jgi:L-lactate dehydrogenase
MKVSVIGCGHVGSTIAFAAVARGIARELVLVDTDDRRAHGEACDLLHASAFVRPMHVVAGPVDATVGSDVVVITAAIPTTANSRTAVLKENARLFAGLVPRLKGLSPGAVFVIVSNPVDVMTWLAIRRGGIDPSRAVGTGTLIDTGRLRALLSEAWEIHADDVRAYMLGEHGDTQFPALSVASAGGVRFREHDDFVTRAAEDARQAGYRVVSEKGYTNYAIAMATVLILEAIAGDTRAVLPLSVLVRGQFGVSDVCLSLPVVVGRSGVQKVLAVDLSDEEAEKFRTSARAVRAMIDDATG